MTHPRIAVEGLSLTVGDFHLGTLDFALDGGRVLVIVGPNGSGKSVTLESIAGFHRLDSGRVLIAGRDVTTLPPERRNVAFLVQNFGLFPHLSVEHNVALGLHGRHGRGSPQPPHGKVRELLARFGVERLAQRTPQTLSPGEKQRVALARALASQPDVFLLDEPFSALDARTRDELRDELLFFLRNVSLPAIFVTHDEADAMTLADEIAVMRDGTCLQLGAAAEVFRRPANSFVARFLGIENVLAGRLVGQAHGSASVAIGAQVLRLPGPVLASQTRRDVQVSIRGEDVGFSPAQQGRPPREGVNRLAGHVSGLRRLGPLVVVQIDCGFVLKTYALVQQVRALDLAPGIAVEVDIAQAAVHVMTD